MKNILTSFIVLVVCISFASGQKNDKKNYKATMITIPPVINGILDDDAWKTGIWVDDFTQFEPYNGKTPSQRTEFMILFDDNNIFAAIKAYDTNPDSIVNRLTRRDNPDGDLVGVIFDSYHDLRTGFLFGISSSGVKYDRMFTNDGQNEDPSWDPNWWVKTSVNNAGWVAEMRIPLSQVRFEKNSGDTWGLEVARVLYRKNETSFWQHIPKDAPGIVHMFGELSGLENIKPRKALDVTPYGVVKAETFKAETENPFLNSGRKNGLNGGIDAKIGITNNLTVDLTINPDFGQVEADPSEVNLTAYETFFEEKRPFFVEGNNITDFNIGLGDGDAGNDNLFYSRRIGRRPHGDPDLQEGWNADVPTFTSILGAAKLTGKTKNGLSLGFVEAVTAEEIAEIDTVGGRILEAVEPLTNYFIGRVQKDFKEGNTILGGIFTGTNRDLDANLSSFMHKSAYTGGIDFTQYFKEKKWMFNINTAFSEVTGSKEAIKETQMSSARYFQRPDNDYVKFDTNRTSLWGSGGRMQIMKLDGHLNLLGCVIWKTPGFETNDLGFMQQADEILSVLWASYNVWEPKGIYRRYNLNADLYMMNNFGGTINGKGFEWNANMNLKNYWSVWTGGNLNSAIMSTETLRGGPMIKLPGSFNTRFGFSSDYRKKINFEFLINGAKGFANNSNDLYTEIDLTWKPINSLNFTFSPGFSKSFTELQYVGVIKDAGEDKYILASIDRKTLNASFRVSFNLSPDLTLQYWGQPYVASGKYTDLKVVTDPMAQNFRSRFEPFEGPADDLDYNDFNYQFFLSNLVIRWEYNPGSTVFLVWSQSREFSNETGYLRFFSDVGDLFTRKNNVPHNVLLVKFSYRFGLR